MRTLLLTALFALSQDPPAVDDSLRDLGAEDPEVREAAGESLLKRGESVRDLLMRAAAAVDPEIRGRALDLLAELDRRRELDLIRIEIRPGQDKPTRADVNIGRFEFTVRFTNANAHAVVVSKALTLDVLDAQGKSVDPSFFMGSGGCSTGCILPIYEKDRLAELKPGASLDLTYTVSRFWSAGRGRGWRLPAAGTYTLRASTAWSREAFVARCGKTCAGHDDPKRLWNRCLSLQRAAEATIDVLEGAPLGCDAHRRAHGEAAIEHAAWSHLSDGGCPDCAGKERTSSCSEKHEGETLRARRCYTCATGTRTCPLCP